MINFSRSALIAIVLQTILTIPVATEEVMLVETSLKPSSTTQSIVGAVYVAPPQNIEKEDRTAVQAAFDAVLPGGTVLFAKGTYLLGGGVRLTVPEVTVLGHAEGTVLRGCDPDTFNVEWDEIDSVVFGCTGFYIQAERQTVRNLTFEYVWHGIVVGPFPANAEEGAAMQQGVSQPKVYPAGGQRIEGNTFRANANGLRMRGTGKEVSIVRNNDFIDVYHAIGIYGGPLHFLDNRVTVEKPGQVPFSKHPGSAIIVMPVHSDCTGHVIAGNKIEGYPGAIFVLASAGETCRDVKIHDNTIEVDRVKMPSGRNGTTPTKEETTMVGIPITVMGYPATGDKDEEKKRGVIKNTTITKNRLVGAEGIGILVGGVRSQVSSNVISRIQRRDPFPGITWDSPPAWEAANGSAIWLSPEASENRIFDNIYEDIEAFNVFIQGNQNIVELKKIENAVRDLGNNNKVTQKPEGH